MISLILLASGYGRRFGSNKLLYEINGKPMYLHILEKLHRLSLHRIEGHEVKVIVVSQYEEILKSAKSHGLLSIKNEEAREGIAASVRMGCQAANNSDWIFFFAADQPFLKEETIKNFMIHAINSEKHMASVHTNMIPGNPTGFRKEWKEDLMSLNGDRGGRKIMKDHPEEVFWYEISAKEKKDIDFLENNA